MRRIAAMLAVRIGNKAQRCCLLNASRVELMTEMVPGGEGRRQKTTDFYTKLRSGPAVYRLDG